MAVWQRARPMIEAILTRGFAALGRPVLLRRGQLRICALGCSHSELAELVRVDQRDLERVEQIVRALVRSRSLAAPVRVFCYGVRADSDQVERIFRLPDGSTAAGVWSREASTIAIRLGTGLPIIRLLVHEVAHALIDAMTEGFAYPFAILEGYAALIEEMVLRGRGRDDLRAGFVRPERPCLAGRCLTVESLLAFAWSTSGAGALYASVGTHAVWFIDFLGTLGDGRGSFVKELLGALRAERVDTAPKVYSWLQDRTGMSAAALEANFLAYHTRQPGPSFADQEKQGRE